MARKACGILRPLLLGQIAAYAVGQLLFGVPGMNGVRHSSGVDGPVLLVVLAALVLSALGVAAGAGGAAAGTADSGRRPE